MRSASVELTQTLDHDSISLSIPYAFTRDPDSAP